MTVLYRRRYALNRQVLVTNVKKTPPQVRFLPAEFGRTTKPLNLELLTLVTGISLELLTGIKVELFTGIMVELLTGVKVELIQVQRWNYFQV